jgi:hypothetical protein
MPPRPVAEGYFGSRGVFNEVFNMQKDHYRRHEPDGAIVFTLPWLYLGGMALRIDRWVGCKV